MDSFNKSVHKAIAEYNMLASGDRVIVALSGGADSVSLLNILVELRKTLSLTVYAAHLNHNLRGAEADRDENFCKILCENYNVELFTKSVDINSLAKAKKISTELCGREARYEFFDELSRELGAKIATAHTASDNAETVIFNLIRGAGIKGMTGISPVRDNIIRPLIFVTRAEVEAYCADNSLSFVTDSTNLTDDYTRNIIRHNIIETCRRINPSAEKNIMKNSELCREVNSFLEQKAIEAEKLIITEKGYDCDKISELDDMLRDELLYILLKKYNIEPDRKTLALLSQSVREHKDLDIGSGYAAFCTQGFLRFHKKGENLHFSPVELKGKIQLSFNGKEYSFKEINDSNNNLIIRTREAGDRFTFKDRKITKSLKKLLIEAKIPKEKRDSLLLVADGTRVIWLEDIGYAAHGDSICEVKIYNT